MLTRSIVTAGALAAALAAAGGTAQAADADWRVSAPETITAAQAGVPAGAPAPRLARAAIERSATELRLGRHGDLRLEADRKAPTATGAGSVRQLRFVQTVGGLRVLWSQLSTEVVGDEVRGIAGTSVRLPSNRLAGSRRISARAAVRIAKRALAGSEHALPAEAVAYAGSPAKPRGARRAYVVQLRPDAQRDLDTPRTICVVVDADTGKVLDQWDGRAAKSLESRDADPGERPGRARAAGTQDVILQTVDAQGTNAIVTPHYRDNWTSGSPFGTSAIFETAFGNPSASIRTAAFAAMDVSRSHWCMVRGMCGRKMGFNGVYNRYFLTANAPNGTTRYEAQHERIFFDALRVNHQNMAHEVGHHLDLYLSADGTDTFEGYETFEGIAEMYTYDYVRESTTSSGNETPIGQKLANPANFGTFNGDVRPAHMNDYCRRPGRDVHLNGYILGHAYHRFVQRVGHHIAGHLLPHMSWRMPAKRTYGSVRVALSQAAAVFYGQNSTIQQAVEQSFDDVGVFPSTVAPSNLNMNCT